MILLTSCVPSGEGGSSGVTWFLLLFLLIPLGILGLLIYRHWTYPEDIVWTKEDLEEYNRKKAEEMGEEYVGQDYVLNEPLTPKRRYQVILSNIKNYWKNRKEMRDLEIARDNSADERIRDGIEGMRELGIIIESPTPLLHSGNNHKGKLEDINLDDIDIDDIDIDALLRE